jgi:hypothetical protein
MRKLKQFQFHNSITDLRLLNADRRSAGFYPQITQITPIQRETERNKNIQLPLKLQTQLFTTCCLNLCNLRNLRIKIYT